MKYIDAEKLKNEIKRQADLYQDTFVDDMRDKLIDFIDAYMPDIVVKEKTTKDSLQQEMPDKETILRICKLHKAWSIMAPWENVEDFVMTNWNSENIV